MPQKRCASRSKHHARRGHSRHISKEPGQTAGLHANLGYEVAIAKPHTVAAYLAPVDALQSIKDALAGVGAFVVSRLLDEGLCTRGEAGDVPAAIEHAK